MNRCMNCGHQAEDRDALYCSRCGTKMVSQPETPGTIAAKNKKRKIWMVMIPLNIAFVTGMIFMAKGCSSVTGTFTAKGGPMGDFTFVPAQCRSGQRMSFFGAVLLGEGQQDGAVVAIDDPVKGKIVKVEIPGSCEPPDFEKCREVIIDPQYCSQYEMKLDRTSIMINNIVLIDGRLNLDCTYPGGGTVKAAMVFDRCN